MNNFELGNKSQDTNGVPGIEQVSFFAAISADVRVYIDAGNKMIVIEDNGKPNSVAASLLGSTAADYSAQLLLTGVAGITAKLKAGATDSLIEATGGNTGGAARSISLDTAAAVATGTDGTKGRPITLRAVKSCDPSDPSGSSWVRIVACSDRIRIA